MGENDLSRKLGNSMLGPSPPVKKGYTVEYDNEKTNIKLVER